MSTQTTARLAGGPKRWIHAYRWRHGWTARIKVRGRKLSVHWSREEAAERKRRAATR